MKRDWDLIRELLVCVEENRDLFESAPAKPEWTVQSKSELSQDLEHYQLAHQRLFGHAKLLVDAEYIEGLKVIQSSGQSFHIARGNIQLTMAGHDLLDTIRSKGVWDKIKSTASEKGIELTFDAIKALGALALKSLIE